MDYTKSVSRGAARLGVALALVGLLVLTGCGDSGPPRYHLSGTITHGGQPIPAGSITFMPDTTKGNSGPAVSVDIVDGRFDTKVKGKGHVGGPHVVKVIALDKAADGDDEFGGSFPMFPPYEMNVDLPAEDGTRDLEVPADWVAPPPGSTPIEPVV